MGSGREDLSSGMYTAWDGVLMAAGWPVAGGRVPSGSGTRPRAPVSRSLGTPTLLTPSSMAWRAGVGCDSTKPPLGRGGARDLAPSRGLEPGWHAAAAADGA